MIPSNGAGGFTYLWDAQANNQTTATAIDLVAGNYMVTVTDANMCTETIEVEVTEPTILTTSISGNDASCFGDANGNTTVVPDGGTLDYTYLWSDGSNQTTAMADGLVAQATPYFVTVTDGNACTAVDSFMINSPTELTLSLSGVDVLCFGENGGSGTATAGGGAGMFTYLWNDTNGQTTQTANGLIANNYSVTVTDNNGCTIVESIDVTQPDELIILNEVITDVDCNGSTTGAIDLEVQGGAGGYIYSWSNNMTTQDIATLTVGTYTLTVTDANLCEVIQTYTLDEPNSITIVIYQ